MIETVSFIHARLSVSPIRNATTRPDANVSAPTTAIAQTTPNRSAMIPESSAPKDMYARDARSPDTPTAMAEDFTIGFVADFPDSRMDPSAHTMDQPDLPKEMVRSAEQDLCRSAHGQQEERDFGGEPKTL